MTRDRGVSPILSFTRLARHFVLATALVCSGPAEAATWTFEILVEEGLTNAPGTTTPTFFIGLPRVSRGRVVFVATPSLGNDEIWAWRYGSLERVASETGVNYQLPDTLGPASVFARSDDGLESRVGSGVVVRLADRTTDLPGGGGTFISLVTPTTDGTTVAFGAGAIGANPPSGWYATPIGGGTIEELLHLDDGFDVFSDWLYAGAGTLVFRAVPTGGDDTIYRMAMDGSGLTVVASEDVLVPEGTGTFSPLSLDDIEASIYEDDILFAGGETAGLDGLYISRPSQPLVRVFDKSSSPPGATNSFSKIFQIALSGAGVAFKGSGSAGTDVPLGIYGVFAGELMQVAIPSTDLIEGRPFSDPELHSRGLDGVTITLNVHLDDVGERAIVLGTCLDCALFADGFELGDTSRWSRAVQ